jgi:2-dehydropantoate 2-reductase
LLVERDFESVVPAVNLHAGLCFICSHLIEPGNIRHLDYGQIMLAPWGDGEAACRELQDMFEATEDYSVQRVADAHEARWKKLVWNIPYNGLCVAMECETREVMNRARSRVLTIMQEVVAIAQSDGVQIPEWFVEKMISNTEKMSSYAPSMLLDARAGRPLEVEAIYDRAISVAEKNGIHIPEIKKLRGALNKEDA